MGLPNKFNSARLTLSSLGTDIPGALAALEQAICDIFGITIDVNVTAGLGLTNAGLLTNALIEQKAAAPVGLRFKDSTGGAEFRLVNDGTYVSIDNNTGTEGTPIWTNLWKMEIATGVVTFGATPTGLVDTANPQTIGGVKTFSSFPVTPSSAPTTDYQTSNKKYVDDSFASIVLPITNIATSNLSADASKTIATGFSGSVFELIFNMVQNTSAGGIYLKLNGDSGANYFNNNYFYLGAGADGVVVTNLSLIQLWVSSSYYQAAGNPFSGRLTFVCSGNTTMVYGMVNYFGPSTNNRVWINTTYNGAAPISSILIGTTIGTLTGSSILLKYA